MDIEVMLVVGLIGITFVILNIIFLMVIFSMQRKSAQAEGWPAAGGTITRSELEWRRSSNNRGHVQYPVVHYSYRVMGKSYEGNRIAPGLAVGGTGAPSVVARYPAGSQVQVFYNPEDPADAVLEKKAPALVWMWLVMAVIDFMFCGIVPVIWIFSL
jgi:hypothetical protein